MLGFYPFTGACAPIGIGSNAPAPLGRPRRSRRLALPVYPVGSIPDKRQNCDSADQNVQWGITL